LRALVKVIIVLTAVLVGVLRSDSMELSIVSIVIALAFIFSAFYFERLRGIKD
jgi:hypothetical protein